MQYLLIIVALVLGGCATPKEHTWVYNYNACRAYDAKMAEAVGRAVNESLAHAECDSYAKRQAAVADLHTLFPLYPTGSQAVSTR